MSATVVIDASAFVRATEGHAEAGAWFDRIESEDIRARAPDLLYAEVASAALARVRQGLLGFGAAQEMVDILIGLPVLVTSLRDLAAPAIRVAEERGLSAYDACYVVLAEQARATFLTADGDAAAAAADSVLFV